MLLKKQTVWLLTMLSLVVVLSVYYITSPEQQQNELAAVDESRNRMKNKLKTGSRTNPEQDRNKTRGRASKEDSA